MTMNRILLPLLTLGLFACSPPEDAEVGEVPDENAEQPALEEEELPERITADDLSDWKIRVDDATDDAAGFQLVVQEAGLSVTTGPAGIAWRPVDLVMSGDFTASASFRQRGGDPGNMEGYGLVVGGRNLDAPDQQYTYFLVRPSGEYLIKRRNGDETEVLVDWTRGGATGSAPEAASEGAARPTDQPAEGTSASAARDGAATRLAVEVRGEEVRFLRDGALLETLPRDEVRPYGISGVRVNHNLDVGVSDWRVSGENVGEGARGTAEGGGDEEGEDSPGPGGGGF